MALTIYGATGALVFGLASATQVGTGAIKLAKGVASGVVTWAQQQTAVSVDSGLSGVGTGAIPLNIPLQVLIPSISAGFVAQDILGPMAPLTILGLSIGLNATFIQAQIVTAHPSVGQGSCTVRLLPSTAVPALIQGFAVADMTSSAAVKMARAIGIAIDSIFAVYTTQSPIQGAPGATPSVGAGVGKIV